MFGPTALVASFRAQGIGTGDGRHLLENSPEVLVCVAAIAKLGGIAAMLNHNQRGEVLEHSFTLVSPSRSLPQIATKKLASTSFTPKQNPQSHLWV